MYAFNYNDRLITFPSELIDLLIIPSTSEKRKFQVQFLNLRSLSEKYKHSAIR